MRRRRRSHSIDADLAALANLSRDELAERWHMRFGHKPPKGCGRTLLELAEAYAIQAAVFGALKPGLRKRLEGEEPGSSKHKHLYFQQSRQKARLTPGTRLVREWNGKTHHVDVVEKGFVWNGDRHRSLSAIAREITGARWSGPRFFGL